MNVHRIWSFCSASCRPTALRLSAHRLDTKCFTTVARFNNLQFFTASSASVKPCDAPGTARSVFSQSSFLLRHAFSFRRTHPVHSRVGWYRDAVPTRASSKRSSGGSGRARSPYDFQQKSPFERLRRWFDQIPSQFIVWGIIGLNGAVFLAWQVAIARVQQGDPSLYIRMSRNVQNSWRNIREGRIWCIIASTFSHSNAGHILLNCLSFYFIAPPIVNLIGNTSFMALYFLGGISCSMLSLLLNKSVAKRDGASHGASGAIFAVMSFFACVSPRTTFLIFGIIPAPAWAVVTGFFIWDGVSALSDRNTVIDGAGHVGGIIAGVFYYIAKRRMLFF